MVRYGDPRRNKKISDDKCVSVQCKTVMLQSVTCYSRIAGQSVAVEVQRHASLHSLKPQRRAVCLIYSRLWNVNGHKCKQAVCSRETLPSSARGEYIRCARFRFRGVRLCNSKDRGDAVPQPHHSQRALYELCLPEMPFTVSEDVEWSKKKGCTDTDTGIGYRSRCRRKYVVGYRLYISDTEPIPVLDVKIVWGQISPTWIKWLERI